MKKSSEINVSMSLRESMLMLGGLIAVLFIANSYRDDVARSADSKLINEAVQEKLSENHKKDFVVEGSTFGFSQQYELKYVSGQVAYEFSYDNPELCVCITMRNPSLMIRDKDGKVDFETIIKRCESENKLLIKKSNI